MNRPLRHIAVNTRLLLPGNLEGIGRFSVEILKRLVNDHPDVQFSFLFDRDYDPKYIFGPNVNAYKLFPPARHPFLFIWFFEYSVAAQLKKLKPDVYFSPDGYLSLRSEVPQVPVFHDLSFEYFPEDVKKMEAWHYKKYFPQFAGKASRIITVSEYTKSDVMKKYQVPASKIDVVYNAASEGFGPVTEEVKRQIRQKYSGGHEFFHTVGAIQPRKNLNRLIEAYGRFREESGKQHRLLIVGRKAWNFEEIIHTYNSSKYREDIIFTGFVSDEELRQIYGASSGLCYVPYFEGFGIPIVEAFASGIPVITSNVSSMPEVAGDAALLTDPYDVASISGAMNRLAGEAGLASDLIDKAHARNALFSWESSAARVWDVLSNV